MKIILASPRGFCAGVNMAIETLDLAIKIFGTPIYVYHEIVHNKYVVERFRAKGAVFVEDLSEVPEGATLLYSAHGVSPEIRRVAAERGLKTIDATCPLVIKVHLEADALRQGRLHDRADRPRRARRGHRHDGRSARGNRAGRVARGRRPAGAIDRQSWRISRRPRCRVDDANRIIARLKQRFPQIVGPPKDDICYATQNRQEAVRILAREADVGAGAGQPEQLEQPTAGRTGQRRRTSRAYLIDGAEDIDLDWFKAEDTVLITAGAALQKPWSSSAWPCLKRLLAPRSNRARSARKKSISRCRRSSARSPGQTDEG